MVVQYGFFRIIHSRAAGSLSADGLKHFSAYWRKVPCVCVSSMRATASSAVNAMAQVLKGVVPIGPSVGIGFV